MVKSKGKKKLKIYIRTTKNLLLLHNLQNKKDDPALNIFSLHFQTVWIYYACILLYKRLEI